MPASSRSQVKFIRLFFYLPLVLGLALGAVAVLREHFTTPAWIACAVGVVVVMGLFEWLGRSGKPVQWFLSLALIGWLGFLPEMGLRAAAFRFTSGIEFGYPDPTTFLNYVRDQQLFWKFDPRRDGINSWGFRGPEITSPKPDGVYRILFLGDSCTFAGEPPYVAIAQHHLNQESKVGKIECVNLSTAGYSSHQGQRIAAGFGEAVDPDLVVVYYGWNDHWLAYESTDREKVVEVSKASATFERLTQKVRLLQLVSWALASLQGQAGPLDVERVPVEDYRSNLEAIAGSFAEKAVPIVWITAPTTHRVFQDHPNLAKGQLQILVDLNFRRSAQKIVEVHTEYTDIVRAVAGAGGERYLLDLEKEFNELPLEELDAIFSDDGIHFEVHGMHYMAQRIAAFLRETFGL